MAPPCGGLSNKRRSELSKAPIGLDELGAQLHRDLEILQYPPDNWVIPRSSESGGPVADVVVIGAGMCGLAAAFALKRCGITNIRILDADEAGREGPWLSYARMETLRSPKQLTGPALGLANLTFQAWFVAQWGGGGWEKLDKIPTAMWMDYLIWYRAVLGIEVENETRVRRIVAATHGFDLAVESSGGGLDIIAARRVVLATGREGMARPRVPGPLEPHLGPRCRHSSEAIDFSEMAGKCVAVIGCSASAFDNAAMALEAGAKSVDLLVRAWAVPRVNKMKGTTFAGFTHGFPLLEAKTRVGLLSYVFRERIAPPRESVQRVFAHANAHMHLDSEVTNAAGDADGFVLQTQSEKIQAHQIIYCTGFVIDAAAPPETREMAGDIRTFRDVVDNRDGAYLEEFLEFPDLGPAFEFQERVPGRAPYLAGLHNFTFAATASHGNVSADIPCVSDGAERLARGISAGLFGEDFPANLSALHAYQEPELLGDEIPDNAAWHPKL